MPGIFVRTSHRKIVSLGVTQCTDYPIYAFELLTYRLITAAELFSPWCVEGLTLKNTGYRPKKTGRRLLSSRIAASFLALDSYARSKFPSIGSSVHRT